MGSTFEAAVHAVLAAVPVGEVVTYGEVAAEAGRPGAARAVGRVMATSDGELPWWRVVAADAPSPSMMVTISASSPTSYESSAMAASASVGCTTVIFPPASPRKSPSFTAPASRAR